MKVRYDKYSPTPDEIGIKNPQLEQMEQYNEYQDELSDRFLYGYLIVCGVIITVLKIFE